MLSYLEIFDAATSRSSSRPSSLIILDLLLLPPQRTVAVLVNIRQVTVDDAVTTEVDTVVDVVEDTKKNLGSL